MPDGGKTSTQKVSTILISVSDRTQVFHSVDEVPPDLRKKLIETTTSSRSATVLIADEGGRREIAKSLQGRPSMLQSKFLANAVKRLRSRQDHARGFRMTRRLWAEVALVGGICLCIYALSLWKF